MRVWLAEERMTTEEGQPQNILFIYVFYEVSSCVFGLVSLCLEDQVARRQRAIAHKPD